MEVRGFVVVFGCGLNCVVNCCVRGFGNGVFGGDEVWMRLGGWYFRMG